MSQTVITSSIARLQAGLNGRVITAGDAGYEDARAVFYRGVDRHPAAIVRPTDADEVAAVVSLAREAGLELAVRGGGHSMAGHGVSEGGIVLDLSKMKALEIDARERTAWAQTGLTAGEYTAAAGAHGLATGFGDTASVGHRRAHARRRRGVPRAQARPHDRRRPRRRARNSRRGVVARRCRVTSGSVLGDPRRRRQLRRGRPGSGTGCTRSTRSSAGCSFSRRRPR